MAEFDKNCTILIRSDKTDLPSVAELQKKLEQSVDTIKADALEQAIVGTIEGEQYNKLLMTVIRFVMPSNHHRLKKLMQIYFEIVDKCKVDGTLKEEMILVCNALRNDLMSPNEYIRGSTLRLLCKVRYQKILEPLVEAILKNLAHRHSYVRRNAVMCVYSIVKSFGMEVIPHAAEEVEKLLLTESDLSTKRNAFLMLLHCDHERAISYVLAVQDAVSGLGDIFQLVLLELLRKVSRQNPSQKGTLLRIIVNLVNTAPPAVAYEGAGSLVALSASPVALKAASQAYVNLLVGQADNNVKLIVLDRLADILSKHRYVLEGFVMDILRALSCPSVDVRRKTLDIALQLVSPRTIEDVVGVLRKEIMRLIEMDQPVTTASMEYRRMLIRGIHASCSTFPDVAQSVMHLLMDFLGEADNTTSTEVVMFVRELVANYPSMRTTILQRVTESLPEIQQSRVLRVCLWVLSEYCGTDEALIISVLTNIYELVKPLPLVEEADKEVIEGSDNKRANPSKVQITMRTVVLEDGTYGTEEVYGTVEPSRDPEMSRKPSYIRQLLMGGDFLLAAMLCVTCAKLALRLRELPAYLLNRTTYVVGSILRFTRQHNAGASAESDTRITQCLKALLLIHAKDTIKLELARSEFLGGCKKALEKVLEIEAANSEWTVAPDTEDKCRGEPDDAIVFRQLRERRGAAVDVLDDESDVQTAIGAASGRSLGDESSVFQMRLAKVQQMTGLADPVYVEAFLQVHQFDLVVELFVINRTNETLQSVNVELSTHGDLKLVDRPASVTLAVGQSVTLKASIKVQSTETGIIFGYVTYDKKSAADKECLVLNELHIDLLDYIQRSWVGELAFRTMWSEFEWENKININTSITDVGVFLEHIMRHTNMTIVGKSSKPPPGIATSSPHTPGAEGKDPYLDTVSSMPALQKLTHNSSFFAINLYSRSIFGEDALANLSVERLLDGKLAGSVRIRSRTQGIALSLGDRITIVQRGLTR